MAEPVPTAPPQQWVTEAPPNYDSVVHEGGAPQSRGRTFTNSMMFAGASIGRWFGVHDQDLLEWQRTGTLPRNERVRSYTVLPHTASSEELEMSGRRRRGQAEEPRVQRQGRNRVRQVTDTLTLRRRPRQQQDPTREDVMKTLPKFWPVFTIIVAVVEVILLIAVMAAEGVAPIAFTPQTEYGVIRGFNNKTASVSRDVVPNFFIGPSSENLIHCGAMYTPCMRQNVEFQIELAKDLFEENNLRCCKGDSPYQCGVLPLTDTSNICHEIYGGEILGGVARCQQEQNETQSCKGGVTLHPCCVGVLGECVITNKENCSFQNGHWHPDKVLCSEVGTDCFKDICEFTWIHRTIGDFPSQGLRFFSSIFLYEGVVHLLIVGLVKLFIGLKIEQRIGWLRVLCIYLLSGIGGNLLSGVFDPKNVSVGGSGALFGLLAVLLVELLQGWKWVKKPCAELIKSLIWIIFLLILGVLPYIDNFAQIGGFIFGVLSSFIFVPYITVGKWDRAKKLCLIGICFPIILLLFLVGFVIFYNNPNPDFCPECSYINCIPFTDTFCENFLTSVLSSFTTPQPQ